MSGAALQRHAPQRQALSHIVALDRQAQDDAPHYFPHVDQTELFHDATAPVSAFEMADHAGESSSDDSVSGTQNRRADLPRIDREAQDRNLRPVLDRTFPEREAAGDAPIDAIGTNEFTEICGDALYLAFGRLSAPIKRIAQVANVNERTAKNWWEKKCAPGPIHTLRLMAHVPEFQGEMRRLAAMEHDIDPEFERAMAETIRLAQRMPWGRGARGR